MYYPYSGNEFYFKQGLDHQYSGNEFHCQQLYFFLLFPFKGTQLVEINFFIICFYAIMHRTTIVQNKIISIICSCFFCLANIYRPSLGKVQLGCKREPTCFAYFP